MKKTKILFSILLVCTLVLVGCSKKDKKENKENDKPAKTGESFNIELESNPSTGYVWTYEVDGDDAIALANRYEEGKDCEDLDGCPGKEIYTVTATAEGNVTFKLIYARPDSGDPYSLEAIYEIKVDKNLKISETHSGSYFEQ